MIKMAFRGAINSAKKSLFYIRMLKKGPKPLTLFLLYSVITLLCWKGARDKPLPLGMGYMTH